MTNSLKPKVYLTHTFDRNTKQTEMAATIFPIENKEELEKLKLQETKSELRQRAINAFNKPTEIA